jgi:hypothetical protein
VYRLHHSRADTERVDVSRIGGGRRLIKVEGTYKAEIVNITTYLKKKIS